MLNQRSLDRLKGVKQVLIDILIDASKDSPYEFQVPPFGGLRTAEEQHGLFLKGASKLDGYNKQSYHQTGKAFDIFLMVEGKASWNKDKLTKVARHIQEVAKDHKINLTWGGDWKKFIDMPHFQID